MLLSHAVVPVGGPTGVAGVTAFFVLSGYLITGLLLAERERTGRVEIQGFYRRRVRRLGPSLVIVLAFVVGVGLLGGWKVPWTAGVVGSLAYVGNWFAFGGVDLGPLGHTWSLAIEEQFYLLWPLLLAVGGRRWLVLTAGLGIVVAVILRTQLDNNATYFATFTRIDAILAGCLVAALRVRLPSWAGITGLALLVGACAVPMPFAWQLPIFTAASMAIVAGRVSWLGVLAPLGKRAYEIYLWDYTLTNLIGPGAGGLVALAEAELTWRLVGRRRLHRPAELDPEDLEHIARRAGVLGSHAPTSRRPGR